MVLALSIPPTGHARSFDRSFLQSRIPVQASNLISFYSNACYSENRKELAQTSSDFPRRFQVTHRLQRRPRGNLTFPRPWATRKNCNLRWTEFEPRRWALQSALARVERRRTGAEIRGVGAETRFFSTNLDRSNPFACSPDQFKPPLLPLLLVLPALSDAAPPLSLSCTRLLPLPFLFLNHLLVLRLHANRYALAFTRIVNYYSIFLYHCISFVRFKRVDRDVTAYLLKCCERLRNSTQLTLPVSYAKAACEKRNRGHSKIHFLLVILHFTFTESPLSSGSVNIEAILFPCHLARNLERKA